MREFDGSLAKKLDFGDGDATRLPRTPSGALLRLARPGRLAGPDKYKRLDARRRRAQIRARHLLDLLDGEDVAGEGAR